MSRYREIPINDSVVRSKCSVQTAVTCRTSSVPWPRSWPAPSRRVRDAEVHIERPDGTRVTVVVNIRPLKNHHGEITGAINCFYDITERKQAEEAVRESDRRKTEFLAMLAHELRNPLAPPHATATYMKWRDSTPVDFRFAVKMPRTITHELELQDAREPFVTFLAQTDGLAEKRGPILVQLPPSLSFDASGVTRFLDVVRTVYKGPMVCEPRHVTWFSPAVASLLDAYGISRVAADPAPVPKATAPAGWPRLAYFRLHGSPRTYWSRYDEIAIATLAATVRSISTAAEVWCVFDNTASGAAIENAWELRERLIVDPLRG